MGRRKWSKAEINRLINMRDVERRAWRDIADDLHDTESNCCARYSYYHAKRRRDALRRGEEPPERPAPFHSKRKDARPKPARKPKAKVNAAPAPKEACTTRQLLRRIVHGAPLSVLLLRRQCE